MPTPVTLWCHFGKGKRFHYATGKKVLYKYWDKDEMRLKDKLKTLTPKEQQQHKTINKVLERHVTYLEDKLDEPSRETHLLD